MRVWALVVLAAGAMWAQETPLARVQREVSALKDAPEERIAARLESAQGALGDWIESRLPQTAAPRGDLESLQGRLNAELREAGLHPPEAPDGRPGAGFAEVEFHWLPDLYDTVFVVAGVTVQCGTDQAVYLYHLDARGRTRVLAEHRETNWGWRNDRLVLSEPDAEGRRLLLIQDWSVQCASSWMSMVNSVYRIGPGNDAAARVFSGEYGFWLGNDGPLAVLRPDELILEFLDSSVDTDIHNRTRIHRYSLADGAPRLDPVALQPQDFAEEWLTRPWSEMESRSAAETKAWHERLGGDAVFADYQSVAPCAGSSGLWLIRLEVRHAGEKELNPTVEAGFLVRDLGDFHYRMESVGTEAPRGCPATGEPSSEHPWLTSEELLRLMERR